VKELQLYLGSEAATVCTVVECTMSTLVVVSCTVTSRVLGWPYRVIVRGAEGALDLDLDGDDLGGADFDAELLDPSAELLTSGVAAELRVARSELDAAAGALLGPVGGFARTALPAGER
jgi:hypothetical protein